jgi:hypothetical protein
MSCDAARPIDIEIGRIQVREPLRNGPRRLVYTALEDKRLDPFGPARLEGIRHCLRADADARRDTFDLGRVLELVRGETT